MASINSKWNFQRLEGFKQVNPPWGEYGYFQEQHIF